jgi:integrase
MDKRKKERLVTISQLDYTAADLTTTPNLSSHPIRISLEKSETDEAYFIAKEYSLTLKDDSVYHLPLIFNEDGTPWYEANLFFYRQSIDLAVGYTTTDELRRKASMLYDFKVFCEDYKVKEIDAEDNENEISLPIDYLDFSAKRAGNRPTYRYFAHLLYDDAVTAKNLNKRTLVVYDFYKFLAKLPGYIIDLTRVEKTKEAFIVFSGGYGKMIELRSQTANASVQATPVEMGYVRDQGEDLRPLSNEESDELIDVLMREEFNTDERLIHLIALNTGARKQSIFTMRMKHIRMLTATMLAGDGITSKPKATIAEDGTLMLKAGPGTGIDTKFSNAQTLHFPKELIDLIETYADSKDAVERRALFKLQFGDVLNDDEMYLFLSVNGNCHYMAKNDPRYRKVKTRPKGEHTSYLKEKLLKYVSKTYPRSFRFHWQRATFAYHLYQQLAPLVVSDMNVKLKPGQLRPGEEIRIIQRRLHHKDRTTTEHYLKLFSNFDEKLEAQERYEERLFKGLGL